MASEDVEFWWVVSELTDFEPNPRMPFQVRVKQPDHCVGYFAVFDQYEAALQFAEGRSSKVQCLRVTRPASSKE